MQVEVIKSEKDFAEFKLVGERHSFPNMLKQQLLEDKGVEFVSYMLEHPSKSVARFVIKTSGKAPKKVLEEAAKELEEALDEFEKKAVKALK